MITSSWIVKESVSDKHGGFRKQREESEREPEDELSWFSSSRV